MQRLDRERIYRLTQEVIDLQQAASSLTEVLSALNRGFDRYRIPESLKAYLQDVSDHLTQVEIRVLKLREALAQILNVNATLVAQRQNEDMKKISGCAAILFAPTLIGVINGMNFDDMPGLRWTFGYPLAVGAMSEEVSNLLCKGPDGWPLCRVVRWGVGWGIGRRTR